MDYAEKKVFEGNARCQSESRLNGSRNKMYCGVFGKAGTIYFNPLNVVYVKRQGVLFAPGIFDWWEDGEYEKFCNWVKQSEEAV